MRTIAVLLGMAALLLGACETSDRPTRRADAKKASWNFLAATVFPPRHPQARVLHRMAERLETWSDGRLTITVDTSVKLESPKEIIRNTQHGKIAITGDSIYLFEGISCDLKIFNLPYLFRDRAEMFAVLDGDLGKEILGTLESGGLIGLGFMDEGVSSVFTNSGPVRSPKDLKGLRMSAGLGELSQRMLAAMGAEPVEMSSLEWGSALQGAQIAGAEYGPFGYEARGFQKSAPYFSRTEHLPMLGILVFSREIWKRLEDGDRDMIRRAARAAVMEQRTRWLEREAEAYARIRAGNGQIISDVDREAFAEATHRFRRTAAREMGVSDLLDRIEAR